MEPIEWLSIKIEMSTVKENQFRIIKRDNLSM